MLRFTQSSTGAAVFVIVVYNDTANKPYAVRGATGYIRNANE